MIYYSPERLSDNMKINHWNLNAKRCSNRRQCKVCNGQHPTILHGVKIEKKTSKRGTNEVAATPATPKCQDEVKCASINIGSNVTSISTVPVKIKGSSGNKVICTYALLDSCSQGTFILDHLRVSLHPWQRNISHHQNDKWWILKSIKNTRRSTSFRYQWR